MFAFRCPLYFSSHAKTITVFFRSQQPALTPVVSRQVLQVSATDADLGDNALVTYSLLTATSDFYVESATGRLYTNATVRFDAERPTRQLVIGARDGGRPALTAAAAVRLRVEDINNHAPEFGRSLYK